MDPARHGTRFGEVVVTIDQDAGDAVIRAPQPGRYITTTRRAHFHSLDEIEGAYAVQLGLSATDPVAADIARALKFAGQQLTQSRGRNRRV